MTDKILVFIPMYNCEKQISRVLSQFDDAVQNLIDEVIVIDNISQDDSVNVACKSLSLLKSVKTTLIQNDNNYSLGGSIKTAFNYAIDNEYDFIITLHGDDQGDIHDMMSVVAESIHKNYDLIVGSRFHKESKLQGYSVFRTLGNKIFNIFCSIATGKNVDDLIAGLNLFNMEFIKESKFYMDFPNNLTFDVHLLLYSIKNKKRIKFIPITWREDDQISNAKVFRQGIIIMRLFLKYIFNSKSLFYTTDKDLAKIQYTYTVLYQSKV